MANERLNQEQLKTSRKNYDNLLDPDICEEIIYKQIASHQEAYQGQIDFLEQISVHQQMGLDKKRNEKELAKTNSASAGLISTVLDNLPVDNTSTLSPEEIERTLASRLWFINLSNDPYRMDALKSVQEQEFIPPQEVESSVFTAANAQGLALSIGDISSKIEGGMADRNSRTETFARKIFVKLGRQARIPFVGSESPDVWNSSMAVATMAASHALCSIPRDGVLSDVKRQVLFAQEVFAHLENLADIVLDGRSDKNEILEMWKSNVLGTVEPTEEKALKRADALANVGVRGFRPYSPEPGRTIIETTKSIRRHFGTNFELAPGQIVSVEQAMYLTPDIADLMIVGVGGGGRCTTPLRGGLAVDWPELVFNLRGKAHIPIIVQGGGSDDPSTTLLLGATGIGVSRIVAGGTIESPGGALYFVDKDGRYYKLYGGEASARNKLLAGKMLPFGIPSFVEGETTRAYKNYLENALPTLTHNLLKLLENITLAMIFKQAESITDLQSIDPSPLRRITQAGVNQKNTH